MRDEYLEFSVLLEKAVAGFYENLQKQDRLGRIRQVLEFMETHSQEHAIRLEGISQKNERPGMGSSAILDYQNSVIKKVHDEIDHERDLLKVLQLLADSEDQLGKLYVSISDTMKKLSVHYARVSETFGTIGNEEFGHRDILLADKKRLEKKAGGNN